MSTSAHRFLIAFSALAIGIPYWGCSPAPNTLTAQAGKDFEWFGTLGFPDPKGSPYVRVATGEWGQNADEPPPNGYIKAFLLATNASSFRVLTLDLFDRTFTNTTSKAKDKTRIPACIGKSGGGASVSALEGAG